MCGGWGIAEPYPTVTLVFFLFLMFALSNLGVFQESSTLLLLISKMKQFFS